MVVPWKIARLFVRCAEYLCSCHPSKELCPLQLKRHRHLLNCTISDTWASNNFTLCCDWSFHMPDGYITGWSGMSYCNQAPFPPLEGWGLGTGLGISSPFRTWKIWSGDETSQAFHSGDKIRNRKPGFEAKVHWSTMLLHPLFYLFDAWCLYSLGTRPSENQSLTLTVLSV